MTSYERYDEGMPDVEMIPPYSTVDIPANERTAFIAAIALARWRKEGGDYEKIVDEETLRYAP